MLQALSEELGAADELSVDVYVEYLEINRNTDDAYPHYLFDLLATKYRNKVIDLVIVSDELALRLASIIVPIFCRRRRSSF